MTPCQKRFLVFLFVLALMSPLGIILPEMFKAEDAWGEWGLEKIKDMIGFIPEGMKNLADAWEAPFPDYNFGQEEASLTVRVGFYILSAIMGTVLVVGAILVLTKINKKKAEN